jgi:hypothetical protein
MTINSKLLFMILEVFFPVSNDNTSYERDKRYDKN